MARNEDSELREKIDNHNRRALRNDFTPEDISDLKRMLDKYDEIIKLANRYDELDGAMEIHKRIKWVLRSIAVGTPIIVAIWQLIDKLHR